MSHIIGSGFGSSHNWVRGYTSPWKATEYKCADCGAGFYHAYDAIPDIFEAIKRQNIADVCPRPTERRPEE